MKLMYFLFHIDAHSAYAVVHNLPISIMLRHCFFNIVPFQGLDIPID